MYVQPFNLLDVPDFSSSFSYKRGARPLNFEKRRTPFEASEVATSDAIQSTVYCHDCIRRWIESSNLLDTDSEIRRISLPRLQIADSDLQKRQVDNTTPDWGVFGQTGSFGMSFDRCIFRTLLDVTNVR
eukprot:1132266-Prorocentrum_minimum.AAC.3